MTKQTILRVKDACNKLGGISRTTLWRLVKDGLIKTPIQISPGLVGFIEHELDEYIELKITERDFP